MEKIDEVGAVAVIGAGVMGSGIAQVFAEAGFAVRLMARRQATLEKALARITRNQAQLVAAGLLSEDAARRAYGRIQTTTALEAAVDRVDFVNESVPEDLTVKQEIFAALDRHAPAEAILATNTSGLSITQIASATTRPERVVGLHWLNPPHLMRPVEITRGEHTSETIMEQTVACARRIGWLPVRVERDAPGFLWNRLQFALVREAIHIVEAGIASIEAVDLVMTMGLGLRWAAVGPFRTMDLAGIHNFHAISAYLYPELSADREPQRALTERVKRGETGAAAGQGFYPYPSGAHEAAIAERDARLLALLRLSAPGPEP